MSNQNKVCLRMLERVADRVMNVNVNDGYFLHQVKKELERARLEIACLEGQLMRIEEDREAGLIASGNS